MGGHDFKHLSIVGVFISHLLINALKLHIDALPLHVQVSSHITCKKRVLKSMISKFYKFDLLKNWLLFNKIYSIILSI